MYKMYDRAPRSYKVTVGSTKENIGPGTYDIHLITDFDAACGDNIAPFNSSTRRTVFQVDSPDGRVPPTFYTLPDSWNKAKSTRFSLYCASRFPKVKPVGPPVGTYNLPALIGLTCSPRSDKADEQKRKSTKADQETPRLLLRPRVPQPPSIPTRECCGYYEDCEGLVRAVPCVSRDTTMGPAYYHIPEGELNLTTKLYGGNKWSERTSLRFDELYQGTSPGPGYYSTYAPIPRNTLYPHPRPLDTIRFPCDHVILREKNTVPDPGSYTERCSIKRSPFVSSPFVSNTKRFGRVTSRSPGPAYYDPVFSKRKSSSPVLGTTGKRSAEMPSHLTEPAKYNIPGFVEELRRKLERSSIYSVFGSNTERVFTYLTCTCTPGPCTYDAKVKKKCHAALISAPPAPKLTSKDKTVFPEPGDHDLSRASDYLYRKTSHRKPKKENGVGFLVGDERFRKRETVALCGLASRTLHETPGPATYDPPSQKWLLPIRPRTTCTERFPQTKDDPAAEPATYKLSSAYRHSVAKSSYNVTLGYRPSAPPRCKYRPFRSRVRWRKK